jgi:hypothetical protein
MVEFYRDHKAEFEFPTQAKWEELSVRKGTSPGDAQQAYAKIARMGNDVFPKLAANPPANAPMFDEVAKAKSDGFNASKGGLYDWTTKGSLKATIVDDAIFNLPLGQMSPILDSGAAFHIVRVLERKEAGCRPFTEVQNDIREKLKDQRMKVAQDKYIDGLRKGAKIWTIYTGNVSMETLIGKAPDQPQRK